MTKKIAIVVVGVLFLAVFTFATANAQTNTNSIPYSRTNVLLNLTFSLTVYEQIYTVFPTNVGGTVVPTAKTTKIATDGVIRAIAKKAQITGDLSNAKLFWRRSWTNSDDIADEIIIRRGAVDTVIASSIFDLSFPDNITTLRATLAGTTNITDYANCSITLVSPSVGVFFLQGNATLKSGSLFNGKSLVDRSPSAISFTAAVAGSGSIGFHPAVWKGTVMGAGQKVEIEQISP